MLLFIQAILTFPAVLYTVLLGVVSLYWISMLLGAVDLDLLGGAEHGGADGAADGAGHAAGDGVGHGAEAHGHHDAGGDGDAGDADGDGDGDAGDGDDNSVFSAAGAWGLRRVPVTVTISLLVIYGWLASVLGIVLFQHAALAVMSATVFHALLLVVALVSSFFLASVSARPLAPVFAQKPAIRREGLVGKEAEVCTGRVDERFGQVLVKDGGAGLIIDARHEGGAQLKRGDRVIITGWDADHNVAHVESIERLTALRVDASAADTSDDAPRTDGRAAGPRSRSR